MQSLNKRDAMSVSELNRQSRRALEMQFNQVWVAGEISNFSKPGSGHWYFTLKDENAQIRCAMFKNRNILSDKVPKLGDQVLVRAKVSLYEARGDYQLIADHLELAGVGLLQVEFEKLKTKLASEGLFDTQHKQSLPPDARTIAVISSPTGAAVHDILHVFKRRNPTVHIVLIPALVQGNDAPAELIRALGSVASFNQQNPEKLEAIIIGRGGGSLEDLWAFNNEELARAVYKCPIPIVSAVGHEIDFSICDLVADTRAATPSAAAEILSTDHSKTQVALSKYKNRLLVLFKQILKAHERALANACKRIKHPGNQINQWQQRLDYAEKKLEKTIAQQSVTRKNMLSLLQRNLMQTSPRRDIKDSNTALKSYRKKIELLINNTIKEKTSTFILQRTSLDIVSPLATLERGYSIIKNDKGKLIKSKAEARKYTAVNIMFKDGEITADIKNETSKM